MLLACISRIAHVHVFILEMVPEFEAGITICYCILLCIKYICQFLKITIDLPINNGSVIIPVTMFKSNC